MSWEFHHPIRKKTKFTCYVFLELSFFTTKYSDNMKENDIPAIRPRNIDEWGFRHPMSKKQKNGLLCFGKATLA